MAGKYGAVVTDTGTRKIMEAMHEGRKVNIIEFAVGDGGGAPCTPDSSAVGLINENWRGKVASCYVSEESENLLIVETAMPSDIGGFTIREMGVFNDEGALIAICNTPDTQKVRISDGVVHELNLIMEIALSNLEGIELVVDPCVVMATKKDIKNINEKLDKYFGNADNSDGGIGFIEGIEAKNVVEAINEVFQLGNEKKNKLVENLVAMGIEASTNDTWEELLDKVLEMTDTSEDTVTKTVLLEKYTAHDAKGEQITGTMPERANTTVDTTGVTQDNSYTYLGVPEGHYNPGSKVRAINSDISINPVIASGSMGFSAGEGGSTDKTVTKTATHTYTGADKERLTQSNFIAGISNVDMYPATDQWGGGRNAKVYISAYNASTGVVTITGSVRLTSAGPSYGTGGSLNYFLVKR